MATRKGAAVADEIRLEPAQWNGQVEEVTDDMLLLGEAEAVETFFDEINRRRLRAQLWVLAVAGSLYALVYAAERSPWLSGLGGVVALGNLLMLRYREAPAVVRRIRVVVAAVLVAHLVLFNLLHPTLETSGPGVWFIVLALAAARFRLAVGELVALLGALYALIAARLVLVTTVIARQGMPLAELVGFALVFLVVLADAVWITYRERRRFLLRWRAEASRHRDRLRMKQELEYARSIQLSMLPRSSPALDWLDIAALSLPATEVGGDYYDYFQLGPERLAIVVGDVTGHGVASGLVLSGVRSSLNLLQEELAEPARILGRVNRMLKKISTPRMLMTLGLAVLDRRGGSLIVATAAHPPLLRLGAGGDRVEELGRGSLPLGAMVDTCYSEDRAPLDKGDLLLLYSDGLVEAVDPAGEQYGWERLGRALATAASAGSAREVRDALLRDVWEFKGDADQVDDVTMVVVRVL
jgi:hypothetical protein